jgi:hypothetical protein
MLSDKLSPNGVPPPETSSVRLLVGMRVLGRWISTPLGLVTTFTCLSVAIAAATVALWLTYNGYCISQRRYLSEQEIFDTAIIETMRRPTYPRVVSLPQGVRLEAWKVIPYSDIEEFKRQNPSCCSFTPPNVGDRTPFYISFWDQLFGGANHFVAVKYWVRYLDGHNQEQTEETTAYIRLAACGQPWHQPR